MTEAEARAIVTKYEALLFELGGARALALCELPIRFDGDEVSVSATAEVDADGFAPLWISEKCSAVFA